MPWPPKKPFCALLLRAFHLYDCCFPEQQDKQICSLKFPLFLVTFIGKAQVVAYLSGWISVAQKTIWAEERERRDNMMAPLPYQTPIFSPRLSHSPWMGTTNDGPRDPGKNGGGKRIQCHAYCDKRSFLNLFFKKTANDLFVIFGQAFLLPKAKHPNPVFDFAENTRW